MKFLGMGLGFWIGLLIAIIIVGIITYVLAKRYTTAQAHKRELDRQAAFVKAAGRIQYDVDVMTTMVDDQRRFNKQMWLESPTGKAPTLVDDLWYEPLMDDLHELRQLNNGELPDNVISEALTVATSLKGWRPSLIAQATDEKTDYTMWLVETGARLQHILDSLAPALNKAAVTAPSK
ncbi:hypothetical protein ACRYI5_01385 [Furfurilactobacillus sp. WILCCON 0119]|uniref:hypothetical protein n=1 Tax=Furfurilactobacillus entadae TaxID=2922307 RepID=UPI0035EF106D